MKRWVVLTALLAGALALTGSGFSDPGHGHDKGDKGKGGTKHGSKLGPYSMTRTDGSSCGVDKPWANDTFQRTYKVKKNRDGTYRLWRRDRGTFVTLGTTNPGKCQTARHGNAVRAGVTGKFHGYLVGVVSGGTFNPSAACPANANCGLTDVFVATFFGSGATFSCFATVATDCRYNFEYSAPEQNLLFHHWQDRGVNTTEIFHGDIADS